MAAARRASVATDSRFLRVLDAVPGGSRPAGRRPRARLLHRLRVRHRPVAGGHPQPRPALRARGGLGGPRGGRRAVRACTASALHHRRISPETVIITPTGNVKIVGLLIEAALRPPRPARWCTGPTPPSWSTSPTSAGCSTPPWSAAGPAAPPTACRTRPAVGRRWMTPRQVRAGVSPALDDVCDQVLGDPPRHRAARHHRRERPGQRPDQGARRRRRVGRPRAPAAPARPRVGAHRRAPRRPVSTLLDQPTELDPVLDATTSPRTSPGPRPPTPPRAA